jgi:hypothetical protein
VACAQALDLFVLGGEPGQGEDLELPEQGEGGLVRGEAIFEPGVLVLEPQDLSVTPVGGAAAGLPLGKLVFELGFQLR